MLNISINGSPLSIPADTAVSWQQPNCAFDPENLSADIVWTFNIPSQPNAVVLDHAGFVYCSSYRRYPASVAFLGLTLATGYLYVQQADDDHLSCGLTLGGFDKSFANKRLSENTLPEDIVIATTAQNHQDGWRQFLASSLDAESWFKFFLFYSADFYSSDDNPNYGRYLGESSPLENSTAADLAISFVNRLFTDANNDIIENPSYQLVNSEWVLDRQGLRLFNDSTTSRTGYVFAPAIRLDWLIKKIFQLASFNIAGSFFQEQRIHNIFLQSLHAMDAAAAIYATTRFVSIESDIVTSASSAPVDPTLFLYGGNSYQCFQPAADTVGINFSLSLPLDQMQTYQPESRGIFDHYSDVLGFFVSPVENIPSPTYRFLISGKWVYGLLPTYDEIIARAQGASSYWTDPVIHRITFLENGQARVSIGDEGYVPRDYIIDFVTSPNFCTFLQFGGFSCIGSGSFDYSLASDNILSGTVVTPSLSEISSNSNTYYLLLSQLRVHSGIEHTTQASDTITLRDGSPVPCSGPGIYVQELTNIQTLSISDPYTVPDPVNIFTNRFHLADYLPNLTNAEFLSALCQFFGLSIYFDNVARRIQLDFFTDTLRADALDISQYVTTRQRLDYEPENRQVSFKALRQNLDTKNIEPLTPVATRSGLPNATTHPGAVCFVENENTFLRSEKESEESSVYHWVPAFGNNRTLDIHPDNTEELDNSATQQLEISIPNMRVCDGQRIPKYLLEVNTKGSSPLLEDGYDNLFDPILVNYRGRRLLELQRTQSDGYDFVPSAYIEDANPTNRNADGTVDTDYLSLTPTGEASVGELYLKPYHDFMARQEKFRFQAVVPAQVFLQVRQLLLPQDGPVTSQRRWLLIDGARFLPSQITYDFTSSTSVLLTLDCSRQHQDL